MTTDEMNEINKSQKSTREGLNEEFELELDQAKQSTDANKSEHPTLILETSFHKPTGEENPYVRFEYFPKDFFKHTLG